MRSRWRQQLLKSIAENCVAPPPPTRVWGATSISVMDLGSCCLQRLRMEVATPCELCGLRHAKPKTHENNMCSNMCDLHLSDLILCLVDLALNLSRPVLRDPSFFVLQPLWRQEQNFKDVLTAIPGPNLGRSFHTKCQHFVCNDLPRFGLGIAVSTSLT